MALKTRFFIIEPSNRPAQPGDLALLNTLIDQYLIWVSDQLLGYTFNKGPVELLTSNYTIEEMAQDPVGPISETIAFAKQDQGLYTEGVVTIAFPIGELLTGWYGAEKASRTTGWGICGDAVFITIRGPQPWEGCGVGGTIHEMIHAWGVLQHDAGIMLTHCDYPNTFISLPDRAILYESPFITAPAQPFFLISNLEMEDPLGCVTIEFDTDYMAFIEMAVTQRIPVSRRHYKVQRGVRVFCYYTWRLEDITYIIQVPIERTIHHTFTYCPPDPSKPFYFYFFDPSQPEGKSTKTPIMSAQKGPIQCVYENFPGPGFDLPWVNSSSPGMPSPTPHGGLLTLYAPKPNWRHEILLMANTIPPFQEINMNYLYLSVKAIASTVGGKLAHTYCKVTYWNPFTGQGHYRTIYFAHETQDCTAFDPLWHDPGIGAWRAPNTIVNRNIGDLYTNPPNFCWPVVYLPMTNLLSIRLGAQSSGWGDASITFDSFSICWQSPQITHPPFKPTHPG